MASSHHRKFTQKYATTDCYLCYVCPENCYLPSPPPPPPPPVDFSGENPTKNHVPTVLILMLCVLGVAFLVLSYLTLARYRRRRNTASLEPSRTSFASENQGRIAVDHPIWYIRTVGLPQSAIDAMALFAYRKADGLVDGNDCAVCLADFRDGDAVRLLPKCGHAFHVDCIDTWLRSHKSCPVCRAPVAPDLAPPPAGNPSRAESGSTIRGGSSPAAAAAEVRGVRRSVSMDLSCASNSSIYRAMKRSQSFQLQSR
ncbi:E3 ubiquitin-protein ligase RING1-like [Salvia hispanica]|uniref:E3 ubiquitin-protein ligase RING1-like n=1 Tax=Salvia hispanica TaxID=49212 RepID=UPI002008F164|nr:E3 ubiquitin-protein ligase RING1-like [Salvia hispanica]